MSANDVQHGGSHYKKHKIQIWDFILANNIGYMEGSAIKYLCRWQDKGGVEDLKKAIHFIQRLIEEQEPPIEKSTQLNSEGWWITPSEKAAALEEAAHEQYQGRIGQYLDEHKNDHKKVQTIEITPSHPRKFFDGDIYHHGNDRRP